MYFTDVDAALLNGTLEIFSHLYDSLRKLSVGESKKSLDDLPEEQRRKYLRKDTKDTFLFDIAAENAISLGVGCSGHLDLFLKELGKQGVVVSEECGRLPREVKIEHDTPVLICDPVDGSSFLDEVIERMAETDDDTIGQIFEREVERCGVHIANRHACNSSVTLLRDNMIKYTVIMNLFTGSVFVGTPDGISQGNITSASVLSDIATPIDFFDDESMIMVCYTKDGKYERNRVGTHLRFFPLHKSATSGPVGPMRFTNLVRFSPEERMQVGVVAHNGEKCQEFLPNVAMALFSQGRLRAYKLFCDPEYIGHRAERGMTPNIANSLFSQGLIINTGIKDAFLNNHDYPSEFRDTTVVINPENDAALTMMTGMVERNYAVRIV